MQAETEHQSKYHRHAHRKRMARIYLVGIAILIGLADVFLFTFAFSRHNPWRILVGILFGQVAGCALLVAGIWNRNSWARYVLLVLNFVVISIFAMIALYFSGRPEMGDQRILTWVWSAVGLLVIANTWLIRSKRIQYLASQPGSGG
jgi:predicted membrane channel-forming protein YqfA (hemolysin III family)